MINKVISDLSYSEGKFERAKRLYESVLSESEFNISVKYIRSNTSFKQKRNYLV